ncbi:SAM-dependent chlorinase/fluorinase [Actinophytocola sp.]|jgi:S-adenosylmethionine hydrolase|uniref:SAM hydrolase/SAM-dependent halogenase family protein n=1 Tax=Actinophytocola sp. TaxID=1872138 RepID=UPI002EDB35A9
MSYDWISFTTDYGIDDGFVAACEGVIARIAPGPRVLHVSHTVPAQDVRRGGAILAQAVPYLPPAVHLAVVDPGVGTDRRGMVLVAAEGILVGPDNGLLIPAAEQLGGVRAAYLLAEPSYQLSRVSATFHGRDVFAPAAAHLAAGIAPENFGASIDVATLVRLPEPETFAEQGKLTTEIMSVDSFGNIQLAATGADLDASGALPGTSAHVNLAGRSVTATVGHTFGDAPDERLLVYVDSAGRVALALNGGSAAADFSANPGDQVLLLFARP